MSSQVPENLVSRLHERVKGQDHVLSAFAPYVEAQQVGLNPDGRPSGIFLLLGPTGTGKTKTVEALAEILHGSDKYILRIDCGEFQLDHEVAKLIGAPPGYLGHRETAPLMSQNKLNSVASDGCDISIVLFDEIEKAAPSLMRILLGVLDKGTLRLGDNSAVNFEKSLIFMTSNIGSKSIIAGLSGGMGFGNSSQSSKPLNKVVSAAVKGHFSPEFLNRVDEQLVYNPLDNPTMMEILNLELKKTINYINKRLGSRGTYELKISEESKNWFIKNGTSSEWGARELKRLIQRKLVFPLVTIIKNNGHSWANCDIVVKVKDGELDISIKENPSTSTAGA